ncbi:hypothetical protein [Paracidovorax konjaci]|uniref:hypothetical protein n=1 Tax=Paracidovorax konjaci TaxID=32040 RepID=UPI0011133A54|nr:hypothetical protein [Paracidovorax konjaci]
MQDTKRLNLLIDRARGEGSDNQLAIKLGVHRQQICDWRAGRKAPGIELQETMAEMAGVDPAVHMLAAAAEKTGNDKVMALFAQLRAQSILIQRALA